MLLALDTSTAYISVAVCEPRDGTVLAARDGVGPMQHGERLVPTVDECLQEAGVQPEDLTAVVVGVGPGPYTGLRVGVVTARTLGLTLGIPVHGVCSLDAVALDAGLQGRFVATADARRRELFWAVYDGHLRVDGPHVDRPANLPQDLPVVGLPGDPVYPRAASLARLLSMASAAIVEPEPVYLRRPDAVTPGPPKKVT